MNYKLFPVKPTPDMIRAGWALLPSQQNEEWDAGATKVRAIYEAMTEASPDFNPTTWISTKDQKPVNGQLIVKKWKNGAVWAGYYVEGPKNESFDFWYLIPEE